MKRRNFLVGGISGLPFISLLRRKKKNIKAKVSEDKVSGCDSDKSYTSWNDGNQTDKYLEVSGGKMYSIKDFLESPDGLKSCRPVSKPAVMRVYLSNHKIKD